MTIREFIKVNDDSFDKYRSRGIWNGYNVYKVWAKRNEGCIVGLPQFALEKDGKIRLADTDEIFKIMDNCKNQITTEEKLHEADLQAKTDPIRYTHEEVFTDIKKKIRNK